MAQGRTTSEKQNFTQSVGTDRGFFVTTLDLIGAFADAPGSVTGEDALSVLNRKLEISGVLTTGTSLPTHNATSPLLFYNTDDDTLHVKGSSQYEDLVDNSGFADNVIIGTGTSTPAYNAAHTSSAPLIFYNTSTAELWIKVLGSYVQVTLTAGDIGYTPPVGNTILRPSVDTVEDALNDLATYLENLPSGGSGAGTDDQTASEVPTSTTNFNNNLSTSDTTVQRALDTLDNLPADPLYDESFGRVSGNIEAAGRRQAFTIPTRLTTDFRDRYSEGLFIESFVRIELQNQADLRTSNYILDVVTTGGAALSPAIESQTYTFTPDGSDSTFHNLRVSGVLPNDFDGGNIRVRRTSGAGTAGIESSRIQVKSTVNADEILVNQRDLNKNLLGTSTTVEEVLSEIDEIPIQHTQSETLSWPPAPDGIDDGGQPNAVDRTIVLHREIRDAIARGHHYIGHVRFGAEFAGNTGDGRTDVDFVHNVFTNLSPNAIETVSVNDQSTIAFHNFDFDISPTLAANGAITGIPTSIRVEFVVPGNQQDARLVVTNYTIDIKEGIDASGFTAANRILTNSAVSQQVLAQQVYDWNPTGSNISIATFDGTGNLAQSDDNLQDVAQKFNNYQPRPYASAVGILNTPTPAFSDPRNYIGGLRYVSGENGIPDNPTNVRQALIKTDYLFQQAFDPFRSTQKLDQFDQGILTGSFGLTTVVTTVRSDPIEIPDALRRLSTDIVVRVDIRYVGRTGSWTGNIGVVDSDSPYTAITGTTPHVIAGSVTAGNDEYINFQQTIAAANVPDDFRIEFNQTSGAGTTARFDMGFVQVVAYLGGASGGVGGGGSAEPEVIWRAGPSVNSRSTAIGTYNLIHGRRFSDYRLIIVWADNSAASREAAFYSAFVSDFQEVGTTEGHWLMTTDNVWRSVRYLSDTSWMKAWLGGGIRRITGW